MSKCKKGECLIEGCELKVVYARGLCPSHYKLIRRLVKDGKRKWEEFERVGMALHSKRGNYSEQKVILETMMIKKGLLKERL